jgi:hypothetical protein
VAGQAARLGAVADLVPGQMIEGQSRLLFAWSKIKRNQQPELRIGVNI